MNALLFARLAQPACFYGGVTPPISNETHSRIRLGSSHGSARPALDQFAWPRLPKCRASPAKLFCMRCSHPIKKQLVIFAWCHPMEWSARLALCLARLAQLPGQSSQAFSKWGDHPLPPLHHIQSFLIGFIPWEGLPGQSWASSAGQACPTARLAQPTCVFY